MMQRNETELLDAWFQYHGYLFGFENLTVFDNGSTRPDVVDRLRRYGRAGSTILWHHKMREDFTARQAHFDREVSGWDAGDHDLAITLECDEFVTLFTRDGLTCRRYDIETYFDTLPASGERFEIGFGLSNVPIHPGFYFREPFTRVFSTARVGKGDHEGAGATELACIRLCHPVSEPLTPSEQAAWRHRTAGEVLVGLPSLTDLAEALGLDARLFGKRPDEPAGVSKTLLLPPARRNRRRTAVVFDGQLYLDLNPDVAAAAWPALKHFIVHGFAEKRLAPGL